MMRRYVDEKSLAGWLGALIGANRVVAPVLMRGHVMYEQLTAAGQWQRETRLPKNPPKAVVFPQRREVGDEEVVPTVLWGTRPCDVQSFAILDGVFLQEPVDEVYRRRREALTIVAFACTDLDAACFCPRVGSHPADGIGADVLMIPVGGGFVAEAGSARGEVLLTGVGKEPAKNQDKEARSLVAAMAAKAGEQPALPEHLVEVFKNEVWSTVSEGCLGCGVCSFLCPTCHCFDIADEGKKKVIYWDCCAFPDFTVMTSGENPRNKGESRLRNRILHKFDYLVRTVGRRGCVGCGRCVRNCPAGLDIVDMVRQVEKVMATEESK